MPIYDHIFFSQPWTLLSPYLQPLENTFASAYSVERDGAGIETKFIKGIENTIKVDTNLLLSYSTILKIVFTSQGYK